MAGRDEVPPASETPGARDDAAGLRGANARLRELLAERDAQIAELLGQVAVIAELREQVEDIGPRLT